MNILSNIEIIIFMIFWFTPFITICLQKAPSTGNKLFWLITSVFFSWLALIARFLSARSAVH